MDILNPNAISVVLNMEEVDQLSVAMLEMMENEDVSVATGAAALALTLARIFSGEDELTPEKAVEAVQHIMETSGLFFIKGEAN